MIKIKINEIIKGTILSSILLISDLSFNAESVKAQVVKGYVCGAETGKVYLRSQPKPSSQNANRTLNNGSSVTIQSRQNGFVLVESNKGKGWITQRYVCQASSDYETVKSLAYSVLKQRHGNAHGEIVINKVAINSGYAITSYFVGEGGGSFVLKKTGNTWRVLSEYGGDWGGIQRFVNDGVPRPVAERLLNELMPDWRRWE